MAKMTRRMVEASIKQGWQPYISSQWVDFVTRRTGAKIKFIDHEFEYKCSRKTARELVKMAEVSVTPDEASLS